MAIFDSKLLVYQTVMIPQKIIYSAIIIKKKQLKTDHIWLVVWNMAFIFHTIWDVILPIDSYISEGYVYHQPDILAFDFSISCFPMNLDKIITTSLANVTRNDGQICRTLEGVEFL